MKGIEQFRALAQPPKWALKKIGGGRLRGMTDINPQWRIQAMTEVYGLCGEGWKFEIEKQWTMEANDGQVFAFVRVLLYVKMTVDFWSDPIPGTGGNMLITKESGGLHANDEAFKMATTDALSSAMKMIGMGSDVYAGQWTGSKYQPRAEVAPSLSRDEQTYISATLKEIAKCELEDLEVIGNVLKEKSPAIQNALRGAFVKRKRELQEEQNATSDS